MENEEEKRRLAMWWDAPALFADFQGEIEIIVQRPEGPVLFKMRVPAELTEAKGICRIALYRRA